MDIVRKTIAKRMKDRNLTYKEVSERLGRNSAYMQQFMERNVPATLKEKDRIRLAELLDLSEEQLGGRPAEVPMPARASGMIPEIDLVAGLGGGGVATLEQSSENGVTFAREAIRDYWRLPEWLMNRLSIRHGALACFPAQGDSMAPTISDGDVVFIDTRHRVPSPPGIYALADEFGGVVVKRLEVTSRPGADVITVKISSDNPRHGERELTLDEIHILGRYLGRFTI
ncbi:S24 family peptidase [Ciceribacter thiooxidans]|uniref:Helix-turn-helix transcriptional regulator n=1 Tax=Ciceribacter thiooxidans TaxID=1969821 RepID=A0ABV7HXF3_9HYPH|nr:S24 family peptidase [Ciceribacter thiooxidans]